MKARPRLAVGVRYLVVTGALLAIVGVIGHWASWPLLTATLEPTAYVFAAHPATEAARVRNAVLGHAVAIGAGVSALAVFGLWHHPSISATGLAKPGIPLLALAVGLAIIIVLGPLSGRLPVVQEARR